MRVRRPSFLRGGEDRSMTTRGFDETPDPRDEGIPAPGADPGRQVGVVRDTAVASVAPAYGLLEEPQSPFDLLKYWGLVLKHRWLLAVGVALSVCLGLSVTFLSTSMYRA